MAGRSMLSSLRWRIWLLPYACSGSKIWNRAALTAIPLISSLCRFRCRFGRAWWADEFWWSRFGRMPAHWLLRWLILRETQDHALTCEVEVLAHWSRSPKRSIVQGVTALFEGTTKPIIGVFEVQGIVIIITSVTTRKPSEGVRGGTKSWSFGVMSLLGRLARVDAKERHVGIGV